MMNYIAMQLASYFIIVWEAPKGAGKIGIINQNTEAGWLPRIGDATACSDHSCGAADRLMYIYLNTASTAMRSPSSARASAPPAMPASRWTASSSARWCSPARCAASWAAADRRHDHTLTTTIVDSRGFTAVMVSWMSKFNPFIMIAASLLLVTMDRGASEISSAFSLNHSFADILTGIILFFIIATEFFITYKVTLRKSSKKEA